MAENAEHKKLKNLFDVWLELTAKISDLEKELSEARTRETTLRVEFLQLMRTGSVEDLTLRERQVLIGIKAGKGNKEIGNTLGISERTVKFHVSRILAKFKRESRHDL